jgi:hypothetical protein
LTFRCPFKSLALLKQLRHWLGYFGEIRNESTVVSY